jgi:Zn-dependent protease
MGILRFQLFGFPISILPGHWLLTAVLGFGMGERSMTLGFVIMGCVFASILVHELGHAFAARGFGLPAQITFHMMGGATSFPQGAKLSRGRDIMISLAGPIAGLLLALVAWALLQMYGPAPLTGEQLADMETANGPVPGMPSLFVLVLNVLVWGNIAWSLLNLVPVIPFDGGRVLAASLGPRRRQLAGIVSMVVGLAAAVVFIRMGALLPAMLFGTAALSSLFRMRQETTSESGSPRLDEQAIKQTLAAAQKALDADAFDQASTLAHSVLTHTKDRKTGHHALEVFLWSRLGAGDATSARALLIATPNDAVDGYVAAAVHEASGHLDDAQRLLTEARSKGDTRVEVTALLVKILLEQKKFSAAANLTREIVDASTPDDVRRVAVEANGGGAHAEAARLRLALAKEQRSFEDAVQAVLGFARVNARQEALEAFKLALGFDRGKGRALLDDERLQALRSELEGAV